MVRVAFVGVWLAAASLSVMAQRVERQIDLSAFAWGVIQADPVEADGVPGTEEWVIRRTDVLPNQWRVVAVRDTGLCVGPWFTAAATPWMPIEIVRVAGRDKLRVGAWPQFTLMSLDAPRC